MNKNFKQTDIGLIPEDWKLIPLTNEQFFKSINGLWKGKKTPFIEVNVIRNTNFTHFGVIDFSDVAILEVEQKQYASRKLNPGDIIIERSGGGPAQPVGRVVFFNQFTGAFSFSNFTSCIRTLNIKEFYPKFVFYSLLNFYLSGKTDSLQARTTGIRNLNFTTYKEKACIPQIPLPEQKKIAYILSKIQQAIETQKQIIKTTQELKKALMQKLFTEGLNGEPQKQTEIGPIPENWELVTIADVCEQRKESYLPDSSGNLIYVGLEHIISGEYYLSNHSYENTVVSSKYKFYPTDILYGKLRPYLDKAVVSNISGVCSTDIIVIKPKIDKKFLLALLHSESLLKHAIATTSGVNHPRTSFDSLSKFKFALPKESELGAVGELLFKLEDKILLNKRANQEYNDALITMLNLLMTGQVRVKDLEFDIGVMNG